MSASRALILSALAWSLSAPAEERILEFESDIRVRPDAVIEVTETITVMSEGRDIRRGIYRDFPTRYRDRFGNQRNVSFDVQQVLRDGRSEPYRVESHNNGIRVWIGDAGRMLTDGRHRYTLSYTSDRQVGFFGTHDELYWNVTGNGWAFPIDRTVATVGVPADVARDDWRIAAYTGAQGERGAAVNWDLQDDRRVRFETTAALAPREGLTIAVGWPAGLVSPPTTLPRLRWFLADNGAVLAMGVGLLLALAWYLWAWLRVGRDPARGTIIPRFEPPEGLSPAGCSYVLNMGLRRDAFVAALVSLGVKGCLRIDESDETFTLEGTGDAPRSPLSRGERDVLDKLLPGGRGGITLEQDNHQAFRAARAALEAALSREHRGRLFRLNGWYAIPAVVVSLLATAAAVRLGAGPLAWVLYIVTMIGLHGVFVFALRAPTPAGRRIMDDIEGFRMYLGTAERDRLEQMRSPRLTPEVFEAFLPYAFALGVQNRWCERFASEVPEAQREHSQWQPGWYGGSSPGAGSMSRLAGGLAGAMTGAIAAASTPPGSSSGSGGGGFSGGGGGGGGGGGW